MVDISRKSGIGKSSGDNFDKAAKKIPRLGDYPQSNRFSFRVPKSSTPITEECEGHNTQEVNLEISPLQGRLKLYDPVQQANYKSIYNRYEKAVNLAIAAIEKVGNKTHYKFRSCNAPTGFWTVEVGSATYVKLTNPILTIICPRPFTANELVGVDTDSDILLWTQTQGRITAISPSNGEGSLNPTFVIIGARSPTDPPIFIRVELPNDPLAFDILVIDTTATSRLYNIGYITNTLVEDPRFKIPCSTNIFVPQPSGLPQAIELNLLRRTWNLPSNSDGLISTVWQVNSAGAYTDVQAFLVAATRDFTALLETHYRIVANFNYQGNTFNSRSCTFYFADSGNIKTLAADDQLRNRISYGSVSSHQVTPFAVQLLINAEQWDKISYGSVSSYQVTPFGSQVLINADQWDKISYGSVSSYYTDPLGGVVIG